MKIIPVAGCERNTLHRLWIISADGNIPVFTYIRNPNQREVGLGFRILSFGSFLRYKHLHTKSAGIVKLPKHVQGPTVRRMRMGTLTTSQPMSISTDSTWDSTNSAGTAWMPCIAMHTVHAILSRHH